jgi:hypothetical protein
MVWEKGGPVTVMVYGPGAKNRTGPDFQTLQLLVSEMACGPKLRSSRLSDQYKQNNIPAA